MTERLSVSVVIPAFQAAETIGRALMSVAAQTVPPHEIVVIDDGSRDGTTEAAEKLAPDLKGISLRVVRQSNEGAGSARNKGIELSTSEILAFLDADDEWLPSKLEASLAHFAHGDVVLVGHDVTVRDLDGTDTVIDCARHHQDDLNFRALYKRGYISTSTALIRRTAGIAAGGFDIGLPNAQDFDFWLALMRLPKARFHVFPGALTLHHNQFVSLQTHTWRRLRCCLRIAHTHAADRSAGVQWRDLWFRTVAVYLEAVVAFKRSRRYGSMLAVLLELPVGLVGMTFRTFSSRYFRKSPPQRMRFID